jgi:hypothetical protein
MPAASTDFHVAGPVKILWGTTSATTELGYSDNEDLVRITFTDHQRVFSRNDQGDMIGETVLSGTSAIIDFTLVSWNQDQLQQLISRVRKGGTPTNAIGQEGIFATVGGTTVNGASPRTIALKILPTTAGETVYDFPLVRLITGPEIMDLGNTLKRIALSFGTVAPASGTTICTTTLST